MPNLTVTVKCDEGVWIGDLRVELVRGGQRRARLRVIAPQGVRVERDEVRRRREQAESSAMGPGCGQGQGGHSKPDRAPPANGVES